MSIKHNVTNILSISVSNINNHHNDLIGRKDKTGLQCHGIKILYKIVYISCRYLKDENENK